MIDDAQKAPADFADRVVRAALEERGRRRSPARAPAWTVRLAAAACVLVVGSAWAAWHARTTAPAPGSVVAPEITPAAPVTPVATVSGAASAPVVTPPSSPPIAPSRPRATPSAHPRDVPPPAPSGAAAAPRKVIVPPCVCHDIACDCGPEP